MPRPTLSSWVGTVKDEEETVYRAVEDAGGETATVAAPALLEDGGGLPWTENASANVIAERNHRVGATSGSIFISAQTIFY
mmetsp:Transcript_41635/g.81618  ORF Transcript_41635/g.81618 Transcript_41635/m.81618 type:complete len:81 (-) Transcript_41635:42-284(-)